MVNNLFVVSLIILCIYVHYDKFVVTYTVYYSRRFCMKVKLATTQYEFFTLMKIRATVFMHEQHVDPLIEIDDQDALCQQFVLYNDHNTIIGTCRVIEVGHSWHIGRIAIIKEERNKQYGRSLLTQLEKIAIHNKIERIELGAQLQAKAFYEKCAFSAFGDTYMEANIEHINMEKYL